ncbi:MAG TPA: hypothetical protein VGG45_16330 [Terracidiphilus sp.]|jgi:hypothetical protein
MIRVIIESPFGSIDDEVVRANIEYARKCVSDSLHRGESCIASHLLFTQDGILNDRIPGERELGIEAGLSWYAVADACAVYIDRGISRGMEQGIARAYKHNLPVYKRSILNNTNRSDQ